MSDFIGVYDNYVSNSDCDNAINQFELLNLNKPTLFENGAELFIDGKLGRSDESINVTSDYFDFNLYKNIHSSLNNALSKYMEEYDILKQLSLISTTIKLQKTVVGGGYSTWHHEAENHGTSDRVLAWIAYLNDLPDCEGETEFLYQHKRVSPNKGRVVIFPTSFTHTHRGNPPLTTTKYIATGWISFNN